MWDQANQFVWEGESGGLATFICFVMIVSRSFARLGNARKRAQGKRSANWVLWLFGSSLFSYTVAFFGISLSDQLVWGWYLLLAMICVATSPALVLQEIVAEGQPRHALQPASAAEPGLVSQTFGGMLSRG